MTRFQNNGGDGGEIAGAVYCQLAVALLCAMNNGVGTATPAPL